jgi:hypothetical protein
MAAQLVITHRERISQLARQLCARGTLTGAEVASFVLAERALRPMSAMRRSLARLLILQRCATS